MPRVSPDGRIVAHISGLMSDFGSIGGDVWTVPITGGDPVNVTKGQPVTFTSLAWTRWGLRASTLQNDKMGAMAIELGRAPRALFAMPVSLAAGDCKIAWDATGTTLATIVQDFTHAPAIFAEATIAPRQLTHQNDAVAPAVGARSVQWTNEGYSVQGWLLSPLTSTANMKAPMILSVHGGPSAASSPRFVEKGVASAAADAGYFLFLPNSRGYYGHGEAGKYRRLLLTTFSCYRTP